MDHILARTFFVILALTFLVVNGAHYAKYRAVPNKVPDEYIVWLNHSRADVSERLSEVKDFVNGGPNSNVLREYNMPSLRGISIRAPLARVNLLRSRPEVVAVEENLKMSFMQTYTDPFGDVSKAQSQTCTTQTLTDVYQWGLGRIGTLETLANSYAGTTYSYHPDDGECVKCYVFDTGVRISHDTFEGRAVNGYDAIPDSVQVTAEFTDENGHGTHVAGTVGSSVYGVAKKVQIVNVKVFDSDASNDYRGSFADILSATNWAINDHNNRKLTNGNRVKSVINMSLSGSVGASDPEYSWETAIRDAIDAGISVVAAAGNDATDACIRTPARMAATSDVVTVTASHWDDTMASFSNYGTCVTLIAPGRWIRSASYSSDTGSSVISGTSMSCPHVAGAIARQMSFSEDSPTPAAMKAWLQSTATDRVDTSSYPTTPDLLLHLTCTDGVDVWVCDDPHVSLNVKGSDFPVCFDWAGHPGRIYQLLRDTESGVTVNARLLPQSGHKNETYIGAVSIRVDKQWIFIGRNLIVAPGRGLHNKWTPNELSFRAGAGKVTIKNNNHELTFTLGNQMAFTVTRRYHSEHHDHLNFHVVQMVSRHNYTTGIIGEPATREVTVKRAHANKERAVLTYDATSVKVKLTWRNNQVCWLLPHHGEGFFRGHVTDYEVDCMFCKQTRWEQFQFNQVE